MVWKKTICHYFRFGTVFENNTVKMTNKRKVKIKNMLN